jgi:hypothetical protein
MEPRIAFCITCKGRAQHVKLTLPQNLADNADYQNCVFILVDYSSPDDLLPYLFTEHLAVIAAGRLVVYSYPNAPTFHMAHAKNLAHRLAMLHGAEILVNLDADNYSGAGFARYVADRLKTPDQYLAIGKMVPGVTPRGVTGRIVVHRYAFLNAGGYDERFDTWSPDDKDFDHRLRRLGYARLETDDRFMQCVCHTDKMRFKEYPHLRRNGGTHRYELAVKEATNTVVNFGQFGCGTVFRNDSPMREVLKPLPTRIFGIGLHKTGTTSLHHALGLLGYQAAHWPNAHWAKAVWTEVQAQGRSPTLERCYAATDLPVALIYRELDEAYPGSKFILTTRGEEGWLQSVEKHWSFEHNPFRHQWQKDPITHRLHQAIYGQRSFDREVFRQRYRQHEAQVLEHFKDRPRDLLVLPLSAEHPWARLCAFLDLSVPPVPYPKANVGS